MTAHHCLHTPPGERGPAIPSRVTQPRHSGLVLEVRPLVWVPQVPFLLAGHSPVLTPQTPYPEKSLEVISALELSPFLGGTVWASGRLTKFWENLGPCLGKAGSYRTQSREMGSSSGQ